MPSPLLLPLLRTGLIALCASAAVGGSARAAGLVAPAPPDLVGLQAPPASHLTTAPAVGTAVSAPARKVVATRPAAAAPAGAGAASSAQAVVIEDRYNRIEELHERGEVRRIQVQPKGGAAYEILPAAGGRDMSSGTQSGRGAAGQRVWPLLSF